MELIKTITIPDVKLPYCVVVMFDGDGKYLRKDLVARYDQSDISCQIENYTSIATINFRNEVDAADFLMRI
jgi:hypothetical protein